MELISQKMGAVLACNDAADERRCGFWLVTNSERSGKKLLWLGKSRLIVGEHGAQWFAGLNAAAQLYMKLDARVRGHGLAGLLAAGTKPLHRPAHFFALNVIKIAAAIGDKFAAKLRSVKPRGIIQKTGVSTLRLDHTQKYVECAAIGQHSLGNRASVLRARRLLAKKDHPSRQHQ